MEFTVTEIRAALIKAGLTQENCHSLFITVFGDELVVNNFGVGICLECHDGSLSIDHTVNYLMDCL